MSEDTENKIQWLLCEWHAISTSKPPIQMNGVLFQDILSITKKILEDKYLINFNKAIDALYKHVIDFENPHQLTIDDLNVRIIELLYVVFVNEGYRGTLQEFIDRIFFYIEIGAYEDILASEKTESGYSIVTTVKAVFDYIKHHDESIDVHRPILDKLYSGKPCLYEPQIILEKYLGVPFEFEEYFDSTKYCYNNYPLNSRNGITGSEFTIAVTLPIPRISYTDSFGFNGWNKSCGFDQLPFNDNEPIQAYWGITYTDGSTFGFEGQSSAVGFDLLPFSKDEPLQDEISIKPKCVFGFNGYDRGSGFNVYPFVNEVYTDGNWGSTTIPIIPDRDPETDVENTHKNVTPCIFVLKDNTSPTTNFLMSLNIETLDLTVRYKIHGVVVNVFTMNLSDIRDKLYDNPYLSIVVSVDKEQMTLVTEFDTVKQNHVLSTDDASEIALPCFNMIDIPAITENSLLNTFAYYPLAFNDDTLDYIYRVYDKTIQKIA